MTGDPPAGGGGDDEAIWRELVARFDAPALDGKTWPEREDLAGEREDRAESPRSARADTDTLPGLAPLAPLDGPVPPAGGQLPPADTVTFPPAPRDYSPAPVPEDDHFIPPPPPPLPSIDPVTKGAWAALFGGPAYLLLATAAGWTVPGIAAFCAVAAFVGGFAVLVLRMDDGPRDSGGPDDGAVV
jgi:hypothetical protein